MCLRGVRLNFIRPIIIIVISIITIIIITIIAIIVVIIRVRSHLGPGPPWPSVPSGGALPPVAMGPPLCRCCGAVACAELVSGDMLERWRGWEGEKWCRLPGGRAYWHFCRGCHLAWWPWDRRFANRWSRPGAPPLTGCQGGAAARRVDGEVFFFLAAPPEVLRPPGAPAPARLLPGPAASSGAASAGLQGAPEPARSALPPRRWPGWPRPAAAPEPERSAHRQSHRQSIGSSISNSIGNSIGICVFPIGISIPQFKRLRKINSFSEE